MLSKPIIEYCRKLNLVDKAGPENVRSSISPLIVINISFINRRNKPVLSDPIAEQLNMTQRLTVAGTIKSARKWFSDFEAFGIKTLTIIKINSF